MIDSILWRLHRAGKTTTISALTGLIEATSGDVSIYGCSLRYDLFAIRQMTGIWLVPSDGAWL
jgi:ABC-type multidrug transport system ATPase subunit